LEFSFEIKGRKTLITHNGKSMELKTAFLKRMTVNDFIEYTKEKLT